MYYNRILIFSIIFFVAVFSTIYLGMHFSSNQVSSSCLECSYPKDVFFLSVFSLLIVPFILIILIKLGVKKKLFSWLVTLIYIMFVLFSSFNLFTDRISSWSSYSTQDALLATLFESYIYIIAGSIIIFFIFYKTHIFLVEKKNK